MTFQDWITQQIATKYRTATAMAKVVGMELSPFTRGVASGTFNVVNLLQIAKATHEHPSKVLRMAGKGDVADLIESLYGDPHAPANLPSRYADALREPEITAAVDALLRLTAESRRLWVAVLQERVHDVAQPPNHAPAPATSRAGAATATPNRRLKRG